MKWGKTKRDEGNERGAAEMEEMEDTIGLNGAGLGW
jgi:hypothetical protein